MSVCVCILRLCCRCWADPCPRSPTNSV
jgi:hypothetical protein